MLLSIGVLLWMSPVSSKRDAKRPRDRAESLGGLGGLVPVAMTQERQRKSRAPGRLQAEAGPQGNTTTLYDVRL
jgi:hypothetical protein